MFQKLEEVEKRYEEITKKISDPEVISRQTEWQNFMKEHASESVGQYDGYWIANYNPGQPTQEHVLWQYTDSYASPELNQNVDANYTGPGVDTSWFTS